jgi:hypothetical protein
LPDGLLSPQVPLGLATYEVSTLEGDPIPEWLAFDPEESEFSGTPGTADVGVTSVLVASLDAGGIYSVSPLVILVEAPSAEQPAEQPPLQPLAKDAPAQSPPLPLLLGAGAPPAATLQLSIEVTDFTEPQAPAPERQPLTRLASVDDAMFQRIEALLFAPAATHAPRFMENYSEAIREFRERHKDATEEDPSEPPPTDEEMAAYNVAMHAWLDADARRMTSLAREEVWDFGGVQTHYYGGGPSIEHAPAGGANAFARPELGGMPTIHAQPSLAEGLTQLR